VHTNQKNKSIINKFSCRRNLANISNNRNMVLMNKKLKELEQIQTVYVIPKKCRGKN